MNILHLSDTHLGAEGRPAPCAPPGWTRARDHLAAFKHALGVGGSGHGGSQLGLSGWSAGGAASGLGRRGVGLAGIDLVVHTGDLFDRSEPPASVVQEVMGVLASVAREVPVLVMAGNHDRMGLIRHLRPVAGLTVIDRPTRFTLGGLTLGVLPYERRADTWAKEAAALGEVDLLLAHQSVDGSWVPGFRFRAGRIDETLGPQHLPKGARWMACGHLHPRQTVQVGDCTVVHGGSTERTCFSERHQTKGVVHWHFGREVEWAFVDLPTRPMVEVVAEADLAEVHAGSLVRLAEALAGDPEWEAEVEARGGWLVPRRVRRRANVRGQVGLFAAMGK